MIISRTLRHFAVLALLVTAALAVGSTGQDIRGADTAAAQTGLVPGQTYLVTVPPGDYPRCRDVSDDGYRNPLSDWAPCPYEVHWYPRDTFTAIYLGERRVGGILVEDAFQTPWGVRAVYDRFIVGPTAG